MPLTKLIRKRNKNDIHHSDRSKNIGDRQLNPLILEMFVFLRAASQHAIKQAAKIRLGNRTFRLFSRFGAAKKCSIKSF